MKKKKHDWNTWENYLRVHENVLKKYKDNFPSHMPKYAVEMITDQYYILKLEKLELITIKGTSVQVSIEKDVEIQEGGRKPVAKTVGYSYKAWIKGGKNLIRYCSPHDTHNQFHHKHDFTQDPPTVIRLNNDEYPHVSEFLSELINKF